MLLLACLPFLLCLKEMGVGRPELPLPPPPPVPQLRHSPLGTTMASNICHSGAAWVPFPSMASSLLPATPTILLPTPAPASPITAPCLAPLGPSGSPVSLTQVPAAAVRPTGPRPAEGLRAAWSWGSGLGAWPPCKYPRRERPGDRTGHWDLLTGARAGSQGPGEGVGDGLFAFLCHLCLVCLSLHPYLSTFLKSCKESSF